MDNTSAHSAPISQIPTRVMGILNVTPDSFSDGGRFTSADDVLAQVEKMLDAGADIIDVGGESSRPFAKPVTHEEVDQFGGFFVTAEIEDLSVGGGLIDEAQNASHGV